jgi:hypothetical protein
LSPAGGVIERSLRPFIKDIGYIHSTFVFLAFDVSRLGVIHSSFLIRSTWPHRRPEAGLTTAN